MHGDNPTSNLLTIQFSLYDRQSWHTHREEDAVIVEVPGAVVVVEIAGDEVEEDLVRAVAAEGVSRRRRRT